MRNSGRPSRDRCAAPASRTPFLPDRFMLPRLRGWCGADLMSVPAGPWLCVRNLSEPDRRCSCRAGLLCNCADRRLLRGSPFLHRRCGRGLPHRTLGKPRFPARGSLGLLTAACRYRRIFYITIRFSMRHSGRRGIGSLHGVLFALLWLLCGSGSRSALQLSRFTQRHTGRLRRLRRSCATGSVRTGHIRLHRMPHIAPCLCHIPTAFGLGRCFSCRIVYAAG